ncbi:MAG: tetratricopeptide repeat protein [Candidatus Lokiarchaeota archaeon]|nr:tetratricopeptide repeat protein [Candidatus Lokiarchaeota archaeon]
MDENLKNILENENLTFLVGAGSSLDPPSCLATAKSMMKAILLHACPKEELQKLYHLVNKRKIRFEQLIDIIRDHMDNELKIIEYYDQSTTPNKQHYFYAQMLLKGNFIMTTNFDSLIERALINLGVDKSKIKCVITKKDFLKHSNPAKLYEKGTKTLYKIHGSTQNLINGQNTKDSLIATIHAFGTDKEGLNTFQVEPFKKPLFVNISKNRSLIIMGYSGSDDFDILPALYDLKDIENIVWINHTTERSDNFSLIEVSLEKMLQTDKLWRILSNIRKKSNVKHLFRLDANTSDLINYFFDNQPKHPVQEKVKVPFEWIAKNIVKPNEALKQKIATELYLQLGIYEEAKICAEKMLKIAVNMKDNSWKSTAINVLGEIYKLKGDYKNALEQFKIAFELNKKIGNFTCLATNLNNMASIFFDKGIYDKSLQYYQQALTYDQFFPNLEDKAIHMTNIGQLMFKKGDYESAESYFKKSFQIVNRIGDLKGKANSLNCMGILYFEQGNYSKANEYFKQALRISDNLGDIKVKCSVLNNLSALAYQRGHIEKALEILAQVEKHARNINDLKELAVALNNSSHYYFNRCNYKLALKTLNDALNINKKIDNKEGIANQLSNIGRIYFAKNSFKKAFKYFKQAQEMYEQLGNLKLQAIEHNNIGEVLRVKGDLINALRSFKTSLKILNKLGDSKEKSTCLNNISLIFHKRGQFNRALIYCGQALKISERINYKKGQATFLCNMGTILIDSGRITDALEKYKKAIKFYRELGMTSSPEFKTLRSKIKKYNRNFRVNHNKKKIITKSYKDKLTSTV